MVRLSTATFALLLAASTATTSQASLLGSWQSYLSGDSNTDNKPPKKQQRKVIRRRVGGVDDDDTLAEALFADEDCVPADEVEEDFFFGGNNNNGGKGKGKGSKGKGKGKGSRRKKRRRLSKSSSDSGVQTDEQPDEGVDEDFFNNNNNNGGKGKGKGSSGVGGDEVAEDEVDEDFFNNNNNNGGSGKGKGSSRVGGDEVGGDEVDEDFFNNNNNRRSSSGKGKGKKKVGGDEVDEDDVKMDNRLTKDGRKICEDDVKEDVSPTAGPTVETVTEDTSPTPGPISPTAGPVAPPPTPQACGTPGAEPCPTPEPTPVPVEMPSPGPQVITGDDLPASGQCNDAFVYCPNHSTCFLDSVFNNGTALVGNANWGFNIRYDHSAPLTLDNCEIYMGVVGCDLSTGTKVGTATVTKDLFHYCLDLGKYEANQFHLYAGKCQASDGGNHLTHGDDCMVTEVQENARIFSKYSMKYEGGEYHETFTFDRSDAVNMYHWNGYQVFPLGSDGRDYIVGHVHVCPVVLDEDPVIENALPPPSEEPSGSPTESPFAAPSASPSANPSAAPSSGPSALPSSAPSSSPSSAPSASPSEFPSVLPSSSPTALPSAMPSASPHNAPTSSPTSTPTSGPSVSPSGPPSRSPTPGPTYSPVAITTDAIDACSTGFVYCPGISTCFDDLVGSGSVAQGWSIDYRGGLVENCEIYTNIGSGCDLTGATKVGIFTISPGLVHYCLDLGDYYSDSFHFYAGACRANDAGNQFVDGTDCDSSEMAKWAARWDTYPLRSEGGQLRDTFTFDESSVAQGPLWDRGEGFKVFPIGDGTNPYLSAHVDVCRTPTEAPSAAPSASPSENPSPAPSDAPSEGPSPVPSASPSGGPSPFPSASPSDSPVTVASSSPSETPSTEPSSSPSAGPTDPLPERSDEPVIVEDASGCEPAWVYCPGRSVCLNNPAFNDGIQSALDPMTDSPNGVWGWAFEWDPAVDDMVNDCVILKGQNGNGVQDCDINTAEQVGTFTYRHDFGHFCFDRWGWGANVFGFYAGTCRGNDNADSLQTGQCDPTQISYYAADPRTFPVYKNTGPITIQFTIENSDPRNDQYSNWPADHLLFPFSQTSKTYISAYTCVVPHANTGYTMSEEEVEEHSKLHGWPWQPGWGTP